MIGQVLAERGDFKIERFFTIESVDSLHLKFNILFKLNFKVIETLKIFSSTQENETHFPNPRHLASSLKKFLETSRKIFSFDFLRN